MAKRRGHPISQATRKKISFALRGRHAGSVSSAKNNAKRRASREKQLIAQARKARGAKRNGKVKRRKRR